jgi:hypothetical protein
MLPDVYGCETLSLTLWEQRRLRVFENGVLRKIFGPKRDLVTEQWRRLNNWRFVICNSHHIIQVIKSRRMRWVGQ